MKVMITGANGHLGVRLIEALASDSEVVAVVRSERAAAQLTGLPAETKIVSYADPDGLASAAAGCDVCIHLVGIIKETANNTYLDAHERPCDALADAAARAGVKHVIALSIVGASHDSDNACLRSRAAAEDCLTAGSVPASILRVPMVLGENDYASRALIGRARAGVSFSFRASSLEQPIYAGDVIDAVIALVREENPAGGVIELGGPESLSRSALTSRAGEVVGNAPRLVSLPLFVGLTLAWLMERVSGNPPVSCDMLKLLDHDDNVDNSAALSRLGISLTSLDEMLRRVSAPPSS